MPTRDEKDFELKRQQIIDGALHVFASKGFEKATNKDIARASKIGSPGLIYHYFKDKADLFHQVVRERIPVLQLLNHPDDMMNMPPREALTLLGSAFLKSLESRRNVAMFKVLLSESARKPAVAEMFSKIGPGKGFAFLSAYLTKQMDAGILRRMDPGAATRCFVGPLIIFVLSREVFVQADSATLSAEVMVETAVDVFLRGMEVESKDQV